MRNLVKALIIYDSKTGNTEKMAFMIAEGVREVEGVECVVKKVEDATLDDLIQANGIIVGSPTYYGCMSGKLKEFLDKTIEIHGKLEGKVGAAFTSSGGTTTGAETTLLSILKVMLIHGMMVQGNPKDKHYGMAVVEAPGKKEEKLCRNVWA
ncbi:MAG: NAD(P)H dehydrogenase (quinone) [Candidatus Bathyarchaeota archaeon BA2]|nr:MAG: NAD(P)H dehydrogenase (quinone) [Candidatus Bathyarchaeota archaeon BA2]